MDPSELPFRTMHDILCLDRRDAELLLGTFEYGGKGSRPDWYKTDPAKRLLSHAEGLKLLPKALCAASDDVRTYCYSCMPTWSRDILQGEVEVATNDKASIDRAVETVAMVANEMARAGFISFR